MAANRASAAIRQIPYVGDNDSHNHSRTIGRRIWNNADEVRVRNSRFLASISYAQAVRLPIHSQFASENRHLRPDLARTFAVDGPSHTITPRL